MAEGFRIKSINARVDKSLVELARSIPVSNISDVMSRIVGAPASMRPMHRQGVMSGAAFTVRVRPGDNLMLHKALTLVQPGDVLVVDAGGTLDNAIMGELMLARGVQAKIGGVVIHGAIRDAAGIGSQDTPVFACGVSHRGPSKDGLGEIGYPVAIGSMIVNPGDLIVGDADGVIAIPREGADKVLKRAQAKNDKEAKQLESTLAGNYDGAWIDKALTELGCEYID